MSEREVIASVLEYLGNRSDCKVWRNNTGRLPDVKGRFVSFGLTGSADVLGIRRRSYATRGDMIGTFDIVEVGQFIAIECKSDDGKTTKQQDAFGRMVRSMGGLYLVVRNVADLYAEFPPL